jgi:Uma2 family endonuclease
MNAIPKYRMTVDQYLAWAERRPGRYELVNGAVLEMSPETAGHAKRKAAVYVALMTAIRRNGVNCHALPDGMTVRIDETTAFEPDAVGYCGEEMDPAEIEVFNPVIVAEVLSPSTRHVDLSAKLAGYLRVPGIMHYLIVDPVQPLIVHHARQTGDAFLTRVVRDGTISLDPPGMEITVAEVYGAPAT